MAIVQEQRIGGTVVFLIMSVSGYSVMQSFARSIASQRLTRFTHWIFNALLLNFALSLVAYTMIQMWRPGRMRFMYTYDTLFLVTDLTTVAVACVFGWYWLTVARSLPATRSLSSKSPALPPALPARAASPAKVAEFLAHRRPTEATGSAAPPAQQLPADR
jgi:hypothetical protein